MKRMGLTIALLLLVTVGALLFRLPDLSNRPMHGDEAVHAFKFRDIWEKGVYRYDPNEYHGPTIYYATLPVIWLTGRKSFVATQESDYRLPIAVVGSCMVLLLLPLASGIGKKAVIVSAILIALSPAFVFYSRYYIQEVFLACFTLGAMSFGWRYVQTRQIMWLIIAGLFAGLMIASKETAILTFAAIFLSLILSWLWTKWIDGDKIHLLHLWNTKHFAIATAAGLIIACLFLSGFFSHLAGPVDYLRSYTPWIGRAHATGLHKHSWNYYLGLLFWNKKGFLWTELPILILGIVGFIASLMPKKHSLIQHSLPLARFLVFFTLTLTAIYSAIPYKTPWCVLSFMLGLLIMAGIGASTLISIAPGIRLKAVALIVITGGCWLLGIHAHRLSFQKFTDINNPYVYAQPVPDVENLAHLVNDISLAQPDPNSMVIQVISVDQYYWPLPWHLRRFQNIGYYTQIPSELTAPVILASPEFDEELQKKLNKDHVMAGFFGIRPGVFLEIWVKDDLWAKYLKTRKPTD